MIIVDKRYFILFLIFVGYLILSLFLVYDTNKIAYLFSDEDTFHNFASDISKLDFKYWWIEIQNCYVGLFPNSNLFGTVFWYSLIYKFTSLFGLNSVICLRLVNTLVGYYTSLVIVKYIQKFANVKLSSLEIICISMPMLFYSPTLLRDNYVLFFVFSGLTAFKGVSKNWILKVLFFGVMIFLFRQVSVIFYFLLISIFLFLKYNTKLLIPIILLSSLYFFYIDFSAYDSLMNHRVGFLSRFENSNLNAFLSLPFPLNEILLLLYSFLGVFPFYAFIILDLPQSLIRFPEMITSIVMVFYILRTYLYSIILKINLRYLIAITILFLLVNIEFSLRRQMIVFPLLLELYYQNKSVMIKSNNKNSEIIFTIIFITYVFLNFMHLIIL